MSSKFISGVLNGVKWTSAQQISISIINIVKLAILTRLLKEETFGIYAVILMILGFTQLFSDAGISISLFSRKYLSSVEYSSLYYFNLWLSCLVYLVTVVSAPLFASFFAVEQLTFLIPLIGINLILKALGNHFMIYAQKDLLFKSLAIIDISVNLIGLMIVVILAYLGFDIYSIIYASIFTAAGLSICYFLLMRNKYPLSLVFDLQKIKSILQVGLYQTGSSILNYFYHQLDVFIVGRFLGMEVLGVYNIIKQFANKIYGLVNSMISKVAIPTFSNFKDNSNLMKARFLNLIDKLTFINGLIYANLAVLSYSALFILFGEVYAAYSIELMLFCLLFFLTSILSINGVLVVISGRTDYGFQWIVYSIIVTIVLVSVLGYLYNLKGIIIGYILFAGHGVFAVYYAIVKRIQHNISLKEYLKAISMNTVLSFLIFIIGFSIQWILSIEHFIGNFIFMTFIMLFVNISLIKCLGSRHLDFLYENLPWLKNQNKMEDQ